MTNTEIINDFNKFKYSEETICSISECNNDFGEFADDALFVITAEYMVADDEEIKKIHIHYEMCYWGSLQFNEWLEKHNLHFEWYDECLGLIYINDD